MRINFNNYGADFINYENRHLGGLNSRLLVISHALLAQVTGWFCRTGVRSFWFFTGSVLLHGLSCFTQFELCQLGFHDEPLSNRI